MRQLRFDFENKPKQDQVLSHAALAALEPDRQFASVKRVSLVYEASLQERPIITSTEDAKQLFKNYWGMLPAND